MTEREKWYQFCMLCKYSYIRKDDANKVYCSVPKEYCPHKKEIEDAERKERRIRYIDVDVYLKKVCTYNETGCGNCRFQTKCPADEPTIDAEPQWIPCSERLPRRGQKVLVCTKGIIAIDSLEQIGWRVYRDDVIAWMPLPNPYEVKE